MTPSAARKVTRIVGSALGVVGLGVLYILPTFLETPSFLALVAERRVFEVIISFTPFYFAAFSIMSACLIWFRFSPTAVHFVYLTAVFAAMLVVMFVATGNSPSALVARLSSIPLGFLIYWVIAPRIVRLATSDAVRGMDTAA